MTLYVKFLIALFGGIASWGATAAADNNITQVELFGLALVLSTALGVFAFPNTPPD